MATIENVAKVLLLFLLSFDSLSAVQCPERCDCWNPTVTTLSVDCSARNVTETLPIWPEYENIIVTYAHNPIGKIQKLPQTNATVSLSFKNCFIRELHDDIFVNVINVNFLDLSDNLLHYEDLVPEVFRGQFDENDYEPIGLQELNLARNKITSLDIKIFEHTPNLTVLDLSGNPLHVIDEGTWFAINSLQRLRSLNLSYTSISELPEYQIVNDRLQLVTLDLSGNAFETVPKVLVTMLDTLQVLSLRNNPIMELNDESFMGLVNVRELWINDMPKLQTVKHNSFSNLKRLKMLHLDRNPILTEIHENAFGVPETWPPIVELYINDNNLRELPPNLLNWSCLSISKFDGNDWQCDCKRLPCFCTERDVFTRVTHFEEPFTSRLNRTILIIVPIFLFFVAGLFLWRVLRKYRNRHLINNMYPIIYTSTPTNVR